MKKTIGFIIALFICGAVFSQEETVIKNKNGFEVLPVQGEIGLGVDAAPFLSYVGDIFGNTSSNTALNGDRFLSDYFNSKTVYGKYMLTANSAVRTNLRITSVKNKKRFLVYNDAINSPDSLVEDLQTKVNSEFNIGVGYEMRRGKTRLQGIYGGELFYMQSKGETTYEYGNVFADSNNTPTSIFDANGNQLNDYGSHVAERITSEEDSKTKGIGVRAFVGVEYFFAPRICLGTEFGYAISRLKQSDSKLTTEYYDIIAGGVIENVTKKAGSQIRVVDTDNFNGSLYLMFYF